MWFISQASTSSTYPKHTAGSYPSTLLLRAGECSELLQSTQKAGGTAWGVPEGSCPCPGAEEKERSLPAPLYPSGSCHRSWEAEPGCRRSQGCVPMVMWSKRKVQQLCPHLKLAIGAASGGGEQREGSLAKEGEGGQGSLQGGTGPWSSISAVAPKNPKSQHKQGMGTGWNAWQAHRG